MSAVGGSVENVSIDARIFSVPQDADFGLDLGGFSNEMQANGDGTGRNIKTRKVWMIDGGTVVIDLAEGDFEFLQDLADSTKLVTVVITYADKTTYQGQGTVTGDLKYNNSSASASLSMAGEGKLTRQ